MAEDIPAGAPAPADPIDFEVETLTVNLLVRADTPQARDQAFVERMFPQHLAHTIACQRSGALLAAGAISGHPRVCGLGVWAVSPDEARRLAEQDPAVIAGVYEHEIVTLTTPKGAWAFPLAGVGPDRGAPAR